MDYFIALELLVLGGYLCWVGGRFQKLFSQVVATTTSPPPPSPSPLLPAVKNTIEIVKIHESGEVTKVRDEDPNHPDILIVWDTPCLGIRHQDGRVQMKKEVE